MYARTHVPITLVLAGLPFYLSFPAQATEVHRLPGVSPNQQRSLSLCWLHEFIPFVTYCRMCPTLGYSAEGFCKTQQGALE